MMIKKHIAIIISVFAIIGNNSVFGQVLTSEMPIIVINTNNQTIEDEPKIEADMGIVYDTTGGINTSNDAFNIYDGKNRH